jgi:hypothetical protein
LTVLPKSQWRGTSAAALFLAALGAVPALLSSPQPDTAWLLTAANRILDGARLYVDVVEVNPPLIVWFDLIPAAIARTLHLPAAPVFSAIVVLLALGSAWVTAVLVGRLFPDRLGLRRLLTLATVFVLLPLSREDFGQREHLFLILAFPYIMIAGLRSVDRPVGPRGAIAAGLAAGAGIALKPYFVLLWLFLEVGLLVQGRRWVPKVRPESVAVVAVGALYLGAILLWTPQYFQVVRTMAGPYYDFLSNTLLVTALLGDGAVLPIVALLVVLGLGQRARTPLVWSTVAWGMAGLWLSAVLQHKGWRYHFYPAFAVALWLLVLVAADVRRPLARQVERLYAALSAAVVVAMMAVTLGACALQCVVPRDPRYDVDPDQHRLVPIVRQYAAAKGSMAMLSWSIASAYPLATAAGVPVASRFPSLWTLGAIYWHAARSDSPIRYNERAAMGPLERYVNDAVVEDLRNGRPELLVVLRPGLDRREWGLRRLDFLAYFLRDQRFASLFERYRYWRRVGEYWVFIRVPDDAAAAPPAWKPPAISMGSPDPGLSGGSVPLRWTQVVAGLAFLGLVLVALRLERRPAPG